MEVEVVKELEVNMEQIGPQGYSAYEVYVQNGGTLSETEWLASLKGDTGEKGDKGDTGSVKFIVVTDLPTENIDTDAIYIKPVQDPQEQNIYEEFIYVNNKWESLGTPKVEVDLSNYPTKDDVKAITGELENLNTTEKGSLVGAINEVASNKETNGIYTVVDSIGTSFSNDLLELPTSLIDKLIDIYNDALSNGYDAITIRILDKPTGTYKNTTLPYIELSGSVRTINNVWNSLITVNPIRFNPGFGGSQANRLLYGTLYIYGSIVDGKFTTTSSTYRGSGIKVKDINDAQNYPLKASVLTKTNTTAYTPTSDYNPATKKYVDDAIATLKAELTGGSE